MSFPNRRHIMLLMSLIAGMLLFVPLGCNQNGNGDGSNASIDLVPSYAAVMVNASLAFQVKIQGTDNSDLAWYVNEIEGGSTELGVIQNGIYTAPSRQPADSVVEISCRSQADPDLTASASAQITSPWVKTYGGINDDQIQTLNTLANNDYVLVGDTASFGSSVRSSWILKLTQDGSKVWEKAYGQNAGDEVISTRATLLTDGAIVAAARVLQFAEGPVWKVKSDGAIGWSKNFRGVSWNPFEIKPTVDGGLVVVVDLNTIVVGDEYNEAQVWKLNSSGGVEWRSIFKGNRPTGNYIDQDGAYSIAQTSDGGYVIAGWLGKSSLSWNEQKACWLVTGEYCPDPPQYRGLWVTKLKPDGTPVWSNRFQTSTPPYAVVRRIPSGDLILLVQTADIGAGNTDFWILKLDEYGLPIWQYTYGGSADDLGYDIKSTPDGGFIAVGETQSFGYGDSDVLVLKLQGDGSVEWAITYGGISTDQVFSVEPSGDGGFLLAGRTNSFGVGGQDAWVLKIDPYGGVGDNCRLFVDMPNIIAQPATVALDEITVSFEIRSDDLVETSLSAESADSTVDSLCSYP